MALWNRKPTKVVMVPREVYDDLVRENRRLRDIILNVAGHGEHVRMESQIRVLEEQSLASIRSNGASDAPEPRSDMVEAHLARYGRLPEDGVIDDRYLPDEPDYTQDPGGRT